MNTSTKQVLKEYSIVAIIGAIFYTVTVIAGGSLWSNGIIVSLLIILLGIAYFIGWYQFLVVEVLGFEDFSFQSFGNVISRICDVISRNLHNNLVWVLIKFVGVLFFGAFIGIVKAILRIVRSLNE